jgi:hypothetical protein
MMAAALLLLAAATTGIDAGLESSGAKVQSPAALTVGTTTQLQPAARALATHFESISGLTRDLITQEDLQRAAAAGPADIRDAARYFLVSPVSRLLAGDSDKRTPRGITHEGLVVAAKLDSSTGLAQVLTKLAQSGGGGTSAENRTYAVLLRDPGVPAPVRAALVARLTDARLADICGHPNTQGNSRDVADERIAFIALARVSWLGTAEAEALAYYKVPFVMDRGAQDHDISYWNGQNIHLSEKMITGGKPGYVAELLAHEGGHAIFDTSGLKDRTYKHLAAAGVTSGVDRIVNEGFAGAFGNRAHVALFGLGDHNIDRHLLIVNDVGDSLASDKTYYANRYHVNTAVARGQLGTIQQIMSSDVVPYLQNKFALLGDPQLALELPSPR